MSTTDTKRYTIDITTGAREQLAGMAKRFKLTQGEVIEAMLDIVGNLDNVAPIMEARREQKVAARAAVSQLKNLAPEQLAALVAQLAK